MSGSVLPRRHPCPGTQRSRASGNPLPQAKQQAAAKTDTPADHLAADQGVGEAHPSPVGGFNFDHGHRCADAQRTTAVVVDLARDQVVRVIHSQTVSGSLASGQSTIDTQACRAAGNTLPPRHSVRDAQTLRAGWNTFKESA